MSRSPELDQLLSPLTEPVDALASRRLHVDKDKVVERMVQVSLHPAPRFGLAPRVAAALSLAAALALAAWGGSRWWQAKPSAEARAIEVQAVRGAVLTTGSRLGPGETTSLRAEGTLETPPGAEARLKAGDGLDVELLEGTRVSLAELGSSALRLERGRVRCVVAHDPSRTFSVVTADARVVDVGTTFSVRVEPVAGSSFTSVHVEEGEVQVEHAGRAERLRAGQSWSSRPPAPAPIAPAAEPAVVASPSVAVPPPPVPRRAPPKSREDTLLLETQLLREGLAAERRGELVAAERAFETLTRRYPGSQLAPDAAAALARVKARQGGR